MHDSIANHASVWRSLIAVNAAFDPSRGPGDGSRAFVTGLRAGRAIAHFP